MLNEKDQRTHEVLTKLIGKEIKVKDAMKLLGLGKRQILRKKKWLIESGVASIPHANRGQHAGRGIPKHEKQQLVDLYQEEYCGWNFTHFHEAITDIGLTTRSLKSASRILTAAGITSPQAHRRRVKTIHPPRPRKELAGELVQVDASRHQWLAYLGDTSYYHLHGGIDDATGNVVGVHLEEQETIHGYQLVLKQQVENYGIAACWYSDFRTIFQSQKQQLTLDEELVGKDLKATKFTTMMGKLGTNIISTTSPQAKGRIERLWRTFQDRLYNEMAKKNIKDLNGANEFLQQDFLPRYNARFAIPIDSINSSQNTFVEVDSDFDYNYQLATWEKKSIHHRCYLKHKNQYLIILDCSTNQPVQLNTKQKVKLYTLLDGTLRVSYQNSYYLVKPIAISEIKKCLPTTITAKASISVKTNITAKTNISARTSISATAQTESSLSKAHPWRNVSRDWLKRPKWNYQAVY